MSSERFDLEQHILECWGIMDDLKLLRDNYDRLSEDQFQNVLNGVIDLYELKFQRAFDTFEKCLQNKRI